MEAYHRSAGPQNVSGLLGEEIVHIESLRTRITVYNGNRVQVSWIQLIPLSGCI